MAINVGLSDGTTTFLTYEPPSDFLQTGTPQSNALGSINVNLTDVVESQLTPEELVELGGIPGPKGDPGNNLEFAWDGTRLGVRQHGQTEYTYVDLKGETGDRGIQGIQGDGGPQGNPGKSIEFTWDGTQLGVRQEGEISYSYVDLKGNKGDIGLTGPQGSPGKNIEYTWNGTQLGVRQEGDSIYTYVDLKGQKGDKGDTGLSGDPGDSAYAVAVSQGFVGNETQWLASLVGPQGQKGETGDTGATGNDGRGINSVIRTSGTGVPGTLDTYTITYSDSTTSTFQVYNGADGEGSGDMLKSVYDPNNKNGDAFSMANMVEGTTNKIFTDAERTKLSGIATGANNYTHPANHPPSIISQDSSNRFVTDAEKTTWNGKAPTDSPTFTGTVTAPTNTSYTTRQVRNVVLSTSDPSGGSNGDIWFKYTP